MKYLFCSFALVSSLVLMSPAFGEVIYDESVDGDVGGVSYGGDFTQGMPPTTDPIVIPNAVGSYTIQGFSIGDADDQESFNISVPDGAIFDFNSMAAASVLTVHGLVEGYNGGSEGPGTNPFNGADVIGGNFGGTGVVLTGLEGGEYSFAGLSGSVGAWSVTIDITESSAPVPEPFSIAVWGVIGMALVGFRSRRRQKQNKPTTSP